MKGGFRADARLGQREGWGWFYRGLLRGHASRHRMPSRLRRSPSPAAAEGFAGQQGRDNTAVAEEMRGTSSERAWKQAAATEDQRSGNSGNCGPGKEARRGVKVSQSSA